MKRVAAFCLALVPAYSFAAGGTVVCGAVHFIRAQGTELRNTVINLRNLDLVNPTTVERITIRNTPGDVVHDSGPATNEDHPPRRGAFVGWPPELVTNAHLTWASPFPA